MAFRTLFIENESNIRIKLENIVINSGGDDLWIPLSDISIIVLDSMKISLTTRMFSALAEKNIGVVICDQKHLPIGYYSSYDNHSRISKYLKIQVSKKEEFYESIWKDIIRSKIDNQKNVLDILGMDKNVCQHMEKLKSEIEPGDPTNREAHAAKIYFNTLMGTSFSRGNPDILLNSALDYGYAIIRAYIARLCVGYGLNTQVGIHHKNEYNRFNLVDDLIEPFRPFVDLYAYILLENEKYMTREHRLKLVGLVNHIITVGERRMYLANMLDEYVSRFAAYVTNSGSREMIFPVVDRRDWGKG